MDFACSTRRDSIRADFLAKPSREAWKRRGDGLTETWSAAECADAVAAYARYGTWQVPTLAVAWAEARGDSVLQDGAAMSSLPAAVAARWRRMAADTMDARDPHAKARFDQAIAGTRLLHAAGVPLLAGTDAGNPFVVPGHALHHELAMLVEAGLSPLAALQAATLNPARFLGATDSLGTVAEGKVADLVLLDADPLVDIRNTRRIRAVIVNGRYFDRAALDAMLAAQAGAGDAIDSIVREHMTRRQVPGLSLAIVTEGQAPRISHYGLANVELGVAVTDSTSFAIASMTKTFTAAAVLLLAEEGKLGLDDPVSRYITGTPAAWSGMTVRQLMSHTAGLRDDWDEPDAFFQGTLTDSAFLRSMFEVPLRSAPGTAYEYGAGPFILGLVIAKVSGQPYAAFMRERIFRPLGLASTHVADAERIVPHRASGYRLRNGVLANGARISAAAEARADVGIRTTAGDLVKWELALQEGRVLTPASMREMLAPARLTNGDLVPAGLGWAHYPLRGGVVVGHGGGFRTGYSSVFDRFLLGRTTIIILTNLWHVGVYDLELAIAAQLSPAYRLMSLMQVQPDRTPARTAGVRRALRAIGEGTIDRAAMIEAFPLVELGAEQRQFLAAVTAVTHIGCDDVSGRPGLRYGSRPKRLCYYRLAAKEPAYIAVLLTADDRVIVADWPELR